MVLKEYVFFLIGCLLFIPVLTYGEDNIKHVLVLNSYHPEYDWTRNISSGINAAFNDSTLQVRLHFDYMDTRRNRSKAYRVSLENLLREKHQNKKYDIVIGTDNNALSYLLDNRNILSGNPLDFADRTKLIRKKHQRPIYSFWEHCMGNGIVGGKLVSARQQGYLAASMAIQALNGKPLDQIKVVGPEANTWQFDYTELKRFGLSKAALPEGYVIINGPAHFFDRYKYYFAGVLIIAIKLFVINETINKMGNG